MRLGCEKRIWRDRAPATRLRAMNSAGDWFGWAFRDPRWPSKIIIQGLIAIIPIVGWIAMTGFLLLAFENARAGHNELPPAGFHLSRGVSMFGIFLIYGVVLSIPSSVFSGPGVFSSGSSGPQFSALGFVLWLAGSLLLNFLVPSLIINTYHRGFAGGFDLPRVWQVATANLNNSLVAGLIVFVVSFLGGLSFLTCIGWIFVIPYQNTVMAAAAAWIERVQAGTAAPAPPTTPAG